MTSPDSKIYIGCVGGRVTDRKVCISAHDVVGEQAELLSLALSGCCQSTNVTIVRGKFVNVKFTLDKRSLHNRRVNDRARGRENLSLFLFAKNVSKRMKTLVFK